MATQTARRAFETARQDRWWLPPLATGLGLAAFGLYAFVVALLGDNYRYTEGVAPCPFGPGRWLWPITLPSMVS